MNENLEKKLYRRRLLIAQSINIYSPTKSRPDKDSATNGDVHRQILCILSCFFETFLDLKIVVEMFAHKYSLNNVCLIGDQEMSFQKLKCLNPSFGPLSFYQSRCASELKEKYNITFLLQESFHAFFSGKIERTIREAKRSLAFFTQFSLNYHQLSCLLSSIARKLNDRVISLFRAESYHSSEYRHPWFSDVRCC